MSDLPYDAWPLFGIRLRCRGVELRPVREPDLPVLAALQPDDYEHDPRAAIPPGIDLREHRRRLVYQSYWRALGSWSPTSWCLTFAVRHRGEIVGMQSLEAEDFPTLRTVDSGSWLVPSVRGRGLGVAMRTAVLTLAFDHLGAQAAVSSARFDNAASLGVSRALGYQPNGVSLNHSGNGPVELTHVRLVAADWRAAGHASEVAVSGAEAALGWFGL